MTRVLWLCGPSGSRRMLATCEQRKLTKREVAELWGLLAAFGCAQ